MLFAVSALIFFLALPLAAPFTTLELIGKLKAYFRAYLVRKYGFQVYQDTQVQVYQFAKLHNIPLSEVNAFLITKQREIIQKHGGRLAERVLGEQSLYE